MNHHPEIRPYEYYDSMLKHPLRGLDLLNVYSAGQHTLAFPQYAEGTVVRPVKFVDHDA